MNGETTARRPRIGPPWMVALLLAAYFGIAALAGTQSPCNNDLGGVFLPSARLVVAGEPLWMYKVRIGVYPNANGPLGEFILAGGLALGRDLGLQTLQVPALGPGCDHFDAYPLPEDSVPLRMWLSALFALFPLGIAVEVMRLADRWRPTPFTGWQRLLAWGLLLLTPVLWDSLIYYGHYEQSMALYFSLVGVRAFTGRRFALAGALVGMALLCRATAVFVAIPLALILLRDLRWRALAWLGAGAGAVLAVGLLPFYLTDATDLVYSLDGFRKLLPIEDGSILTFFRYSPLATTLQPLDSTLALIAATALSVALLGLRWRGGWRVTADDPRLYAVICVSAACFTLFIKAVWGYYFYDPLIWGTAWVLASRDRQQHWLEIVAPSLVCTALMLITELRIALGSQYFNDTGAARTWVLVESAAEFVGLVALQATIVAIIARRPTATIGTADAKPTAWPVSEKSDKTAEVAETVPPPKWGSGTTDSTGQPSPMV